MKRIFRFDLASCLVAFGVVLILGLFLLAPLASVEGQSFRGGNPGSNLVELSPPISTSSPVTTVAPLPVGKQVKAFNRLLGVLKVTSGPVSSALDVYFQYSADDGMTWQDFAHVNTTSTSGTWFIPVSVIAAGPTSVPTLYDGTLPNNTIVQGPVGDKLRIKYSATVGTPGTWSFQAFVCPD